MPFAARTGLADSASRRRFVGLTTGSHEARLVGSRACVVESQTQLEGNAMPRIQPGPRQRPMPVDSGANPGAWRPRQRLWIDINGHNAIGPGKVRLLQAIAATKSLVTAAKQLHMSYRQAWKHLRFIEDRTELTVVVPRRGGPGGGGTDLTPQGQALVEAFHNFRREVEEYTRLACARHFARWNSPGPQSQLS